MKCRAIGAGPAGLRTAAALRIEVPSALRLRAEKVFERGGGAARRMPSRHWG